MVRKFIGNHFLFENYKAMICTCTPPGQKYPDTSEIADLITNFGRSLYHQFLAKLNIVFFNRLV